MRVSVKIQAEAINLNEEALFFTGEPGDYGALVTFAGFVRPEGERGQKIETLTLEHYPGMAEEQIKRWIAEAGERWPLSAVRITHRTGSLSPGEAIVWVAVASQHRAAAFTACEFLMDHLKSAVPFWKKEASSADESHWLDSREEDGRRLARWQRADT